MDIVLRLSLIAISLIGTESNSQELNTPSKSLSNDAWLQNLLPDDYNKHQAPFAGQTKTNVLFIMNPITITDLSPKRMEMTVESEFVITWKDNRLNKEVLEGIGKLSPITQFPKYLSKQLWHPQLQFGNCKGCDNVMYLPEAAILHYNHEEKAINALLRRTITYVCQFDMSKYPFDNQLCSIVLMSSSNQPLSMSYGISEINVTLLNAPPKYKVFSFTFANCLYDKNLFSSCKTYNFKLQRNRFRSIILVFIPSAFIVIISWVSFWLDPVIAGPRVFVGFISLLILSTQFACFQYNLSSTSTVMALDIWIFSCIAFVCASLCEFAYVSYRICKIQRKNARQNLMSVITIKTKNSRKQSRYSPKTIDDVSKYAFPLIFIVFNITFWGNYYM